MTTDDFAARMEKDVAFGDLVKKLSREITRLVTTTVTEIVDAKRDQEIEGLKLDVKRFTEEAELTSRLAKEAHNSFVNAAKKRDELRLQVADPDYPESLLKKHGFTGSTYEKIIAIAVEAQRENRRLELIEEIYAIDQWPPDKVVEMLKVMTAEERLRVVRNTFCLHCGTLALPCHCWNDACLSGSHPRS